MSKSFGFHWCGLLLLVLSGSGCGGGGNSLSEKEAVRLITEAEGLPKDRIYQGCIRGSHVVKSWSGTRHYFPSDDPLYEEIDRLVQQGFLKARSDGSENLTNFALTDKGKEILASGLVHVKKMEITDEKDYPLYGELCIYTHMDGRIELEELLVDSATGIATASYRVLPKPTDYFQYLQSIDPSRVSVFEELLNKQSEKTIKLKRWDEGWRPLK
ncbi:MAG: hypothetical protein RJQ07_05110 [Pseudomonadales bacterium]